MRYRGPSNAVAGRAASDVLRTQARYLLARVAAWFGARPRAEIADIAAEERLRLFDLAQRVGQVGSWVSGLSEDDRLIWSAGAFRIFGVNEEKWDGRVASFFALVHADDREAVARAAAAAVAGGARYDIEHRIVRPDGIVRWVREQADVVRDAAGKPLRLIGAVQDITERKAAEEALRLSEQRLQDFVATASDMTWETDGDHRISYLSTHQPGLDDKARGRIGRSRWEMADDKLEEAAKWREHLAVLARREPFRDFVYRSSFLHDAPRYMSVSGQPRFDAQGRFVGYRGTTRDVTAEYTARAQQRLSDARLRDFLEMASDSYWETGPDHRYTFFATERQSLNKAEAAARIGKLRSEFAADRDEEQQKWATHMALLDRHELFRDFVFRVRRTAGHEDYISVNGKPVFDATGKFTGYRGASRSVTSARATEERLREAKIAAETASAAKTSLLANMSHELRTPLNAVIGFSEMLAAGYFGDLNGKQNEYVRDIQSSGNHLLLLINDLLDVAKIEAGKLELQRESIDLLEEVHACLRFVRPRAEEGGVALSVKTTEGQLYYRADRRAIKQVLLNLLSNAVKFTKPGGSVSIDLQGETDGALSISVIDTGIGIAAQDLSKVVTPFGALARKVEVKRANEGTGLGLPLSKSLIELHGGRLEIVSELGRGTIATIRLPAPSD